MASLSKKVLTPSCLPQAAELPYFSWLDYLISVVFPDFSLMHLLLKQLCVFVSLPHSKWLKNHLCLHKNQAGFSKAELLLLLWVKLGGKVSAQQLSTAGEARNGWRKFEFGGSSPGNPEVPFTPLALECVTKRFSPLSPHFHSPTSLDSCNSFSAFQGGSLYQSFI